MTAEHGQEKAFKYEIFDKKFLLLLRMKKHLIMHEEETSMCKFFANNQHCSYEQIGCKFSEQSEKDNDDEDLEKVSDDDSYEFVENQCHLCKLQLLSRDDLYNHVETNHGKAEFEVIWKCVFWSL